MAGRALQILLWDQTNQYTHISPVVITAVLRGDQILLAHPNHPGKMYSLIAGFVEAGETLEEGVQREIMEEVGMK